MRSERDIKRPPKRASTSPETPKAQTDAAPAVHAGVKVSYAPRSERPHGDRPHGDRPRGDRPQGDRFRADERRGGPRRDDERGRPAPERRAGDRARPERAPGDRPFGDRPAGDRSFGDRSFGDRPFNERPRNDRPRSDRPLGDRPPGDRPRADRPATERPRTVRDPYQRDARGPFDTERRGPQTQNPAPHRGTTAPSPVTGAGAEGVRLSKVLSDRGLASRREADDWIDAGWVKVNGQMAVLGQRVKTTDQIEVDPAAHSQQAQRVTILLNKPIGYVSGQAEDGYEPASVLVRAENHWAEDPSRKSFHPGHARHLAPAGRLDIDSTGLLVLTQDGRIAKHLIGETSDVEKEYLVRVEAIDPARALDEAGLALLNHGLELDGVQLKPAKVSWANEDQLRFVLREGRKRQIRRMCEAVGLKVTALKRVRIGSVVLGKLPPGQWRYLRFDERF